MSSAAPLSPSPSPDPGLFRAHVADPQQALKAAGATGIFQQLAQEWIRLGALPSMTQTLRRWGRADPVLAQVTSLGALVDRIDASHGDDEDAASGVAGRRGVCGRSGRWHYRGRSSSWRAAISMSRPSLRTRRSR